MLSCTLEVSELTPIAMVTSYQPSTSRGPPADQPPPAQRLEFQTFREERRLHRFGGASRCHGGGAGHGPIVVPFSGQVLPFARRRGEFAILRFLFLKLILYYFFYKFSLFQSRLPFSRFIGPVLFVKAVLHYSLVDCRPMLKA